MSWIACIIAYGLLSAFLLAKTEVRLGPPTGRCGQCKYDLGGLPPGSCCPECGSTKPEPSTCTTLLNVNRPRLARWWPSLLVLVAALVAVSLLRTSVLTLAYVREGFTTEQARHVIPIRGHGDDVGGLLLPLLTLLAATPLTALLTTTRQAAATAAAMAILGILLMIISALR